MLPVIRGNRLDAFINGNNTCPSETGATAKGLEPNPKFDEWVVTDQLLLGWLYSSISVDVAAPFINYKTSHELWTNIEELAGAANKAKEMWYKVELQRTQNDQ